MLAGIVAADDGRAAVARRRHREAVGDAAAHGGASYNDIIRKGHLIIYLITGRGEAGARVRDGGSDARPLDVEVHEVEPDPADVVGGAADLVLAAAVGDARRRLLDQERAVLG